MNSFYHSTRGKTDNVTSKQAILRGIAPDGGLYVADWIGEEKLDLAQVCNQTFQENARLVLGALLPDYTEAEIAQCVGAAYGEQWDTPSCCPVSALGDDWLLELYHGPTSAFKDVALQMLPQLFSGGYSTLAVFIQQVIALFLCLRVVSRIARTLGAYSGVTQLFYLALMRFGLGLQL